MHALENARRLETLFLEMDASNKSNAALALREPEIATARQRITLEQKASAIRPEHELWQQARRQAESSNRELDQLRATLPRLQNAVDEAVKLHISAEHNVPLIKQLEAETTRLQGLEPKLAEWTRTLTVVETSYKSLQQISTDTERLKKVATDLSTEIPKTERRWSEVLDARSHIPQLETDLKSATDALSYLRQRVQLSTDLAAKERALETRKASGKKLAEQHQRLRQSLSDEQTRWNNGQAELLASQLSEGDPCPVCGSIQHPSPAHTGDSTNLPSQEKLESARDTVADTEKKLDEARDAFRQADKEVAELRAKRDALPEVGIVAAELQMRFEKLTTDLVRLRKLVASTSETELTELRKKSEQAQVAKSAAETKLAEAEASLHRYQSAAIF